MFFCCAHHALNHPLSHGQLVIMDALCTEHGRKHNSVLNMAVVFWKGPLESTADCIPHTTVYVWEAMESTCMSMRWANSAKRSS